MNNTYPTSTADYDFVFLKILLKNVFEKLELIECAKTGLINKLKRDKLQFVRGLLQSFNLYSNLFIDFSLFSIISSHLNSCVQCKNEAGRKTAKKLPPNFD